MAYNRVILQGNLTRDPELRQAKIGDDEVPVVNFTVAVNRPGSKTDAVDFLNCVAWRGLGETIASYKKKGDSVLVEGRIQTRTYEKDGEKRYATDIQAENVQFLSSAAGNSGGNGNDTADDDDSEGIPF